MRRWQSGLGPYQRRWGIAATLIAGVTITCATFATPSGAALRHRSVANLLLNGGAGVGDVSVQGWDSVTIPGWRVVTGLPTIVRYGTPGFPERSGSGLRRLFAGGAGGTAVLAQRVPLRSPRGTTLAPGTRYRLSAWLGGSSTSAASVIATFFSTTARPVGKVTIGPAGEASRATLFQRTVSGGLPPGAASAEIALHLATRLTNYDGPRAPIVGYNRAVAGRLALTVDAPARMRPPLAPPPARVPRYDHVFLFIFENQDFHAVIGNRRQAPFLNGLLPRASSLSNMFAEEHPSDGDYLALAAGGVFGIPLTDPLEENPRFAVRVRQIGSLLDAAHETWKAYLQSAAGPCDDTVHGYYWNDDLPFLYFPEVRDRPAYCSAHVVPLEALHSDLASAATTPDFVWVGANDCSDMEGCGIRAGDDFLAEILGSVLRSPAWRTQRSLAIITFDEDGYDHEHPPQRIPTVVLGSCGVRAGYVSHVRYTHYSQLRTIEAALGLPTLTKNDLYAQPLNDVFDGRHTAAATQSALAAGHPVTAARRLGAAIPPVIAAIHPVIAAIRAAFGVVHRAIPSGQVSIAHLHIRARPRRSATAFVANYASATVTPISLRTGRARRPIRVGARPAAIALAPDGHTVYVVDSGANTVTPIDTLTSKPGEPIRVGSDPRAIAITPDGRTAYVVNSGSDSVTPIDTVTRVPGSPIAVGPQPRAIALTPDGKTAYVLNWSGGSVTPIDTATNAAGPAIAVGSYPSAIAMSPTTAYIANYGSNTVTPIRTRTDRAGRSVRVGQAPDALAVTPDGGTIEVVGGDAEAVTPIAASRLIPRQPISVGYSPTAVAIARDGATAWVVNTISGTVTPIDVHTDHAERAISVGRYSYPTAIALAPGGGTAVVLDTYAGRVSLLDTQTGRASPAIKVGGYPVAVAIGP